MVKYDPLQHEDPNEPYDNKLGPKRDEMFWSWEVDQMPHQQTRLRVAQNCTTHWMLWEAFQCSDGMNHPPSKSCFFVDRKGRFWLIQAQYFNTHERLVKYLQHDGVDKFWATANILPSDFYQWEEGKEDGVPAGR
jgi:hypothetical protein